MNAVRAYYDGNVFVPVEPVLAQRNQSAIITILNEITKEEKPYMKFFGCLSDESYNEIMEALKDTERIDEDEW